MKQALFMAAILVAPLPCFADIAEAAVDFHEGRFETALTTLEPLARAGDPSAEYLLGRMYFGGSGVAEDRTKALEYFDAAAKRGNAAAQCALGTIYYAGEGVPKDAGKAASWFQRAVDQISRRRGHFLPGSTKWVREFRETRRAQSYCAVRTCGVIPG